MKRNMESSKLRRIYKSQAGMALATVLLIGVVMTLLVTATMTFAVNSLDLSRRDQDWNAALAAAEAGVDDYLYRLNRIDAYWQYSDTNPPPPAVDVNNAFTQWVPVPGDTNEGRFRYKVDSSTFSIDGSIKLTSTGLVRNSTRTVHTTLRRRNFLDYLYFTDYETVDPAAYSLALGYPFDAITAQQECGRHFYEDPPGRDDDCRDINFISQDVINGPLHTNDALLIAGNPQFQGDTSTSWNDPAGKRWRKNPCCSSSPQFKTGDPSFDTELELPPSNSALKTYTDPALGETGCLFTGPTRIVLNNNATMAVTSPFTPSGGNCAWTAGSSTQTKPLPANGVVYVQSVPAGGPNSNCTTHPLGYPKFSNDITKYDCKVGDVFLESAPTGFKGRLTIAAQNNIVITEDVKYVTSTGNDLLGLVADNYVEIYHPVRCTNFNRGVCTSGAELILNGSLTDVTVQAAMLSVRHSFRVQNYFMGSPRDDLTVFGAIAQSYRGAVGTFSGGNVATGYEKKYGYDQRLKFQSPPHFLDPVESAWQVKTWAEMKPCYPSETGAARAEAPCI